MVRAELWRVVLVVVAHLVAATGLFGCQNAGSDPPAPALAIQQTLTTLSNPSGSGSGSSEPASPSIGSFAVYATEAIELNSGALITGCSVGVENTTGPFLGGGAAAYFNSGASIQSTQTLYAYSTYLNSGASTGPVDTDQLTDHSGATHGTVSSFPAMPPPPALPPATAGTTPVTLNSGASKTLAAGAYASVTVNSGAKLTLTGGAYVFSSLTLNSGASLAVTAATTVSVTGGASFSSGSFAGPVSGLGLTAKALVLYFDSSSAINVNSGAQVQALFVATNALVTVNTSKFTGALAAAQVLMNSGATVTCQDGFGSITAVNLCAGVTCTALDQCHRVGVCDESTGVCSNPEAPTGTACNNGNLCDTGDTCQAGTCVGGPPVVCTAAGPCSAVGTCNPSTGVCSNPNAPDGTSCTDSDLCTTEDTCQSGACVGGPPVVCTASGQCSVLGVCNPATGVCSIPNAPDGTSCNNGNLCDTGDTCLGGTCVGGPPVVCTASGQCGAIGTCNPSTGVCSSPNAPDGTSCNNGNACDTNDTCQSGTCVGGPPVVCATAGPCFVAGTCDPATGACSNPTAANGTACSDSNLCTTGDICQNGTCAGTPVTCTASGQCSTSGTCDPMTGVCSNPPAPNGTACNGGNPCLQGATCQSGACSGGSPVTCVASDACHVPGSCSVGDGGAGGCSNPPAPSGTTCAVGACGGTCDGNGACDQSANPSNVCYSSTCSTSTGVTTTPNLCVPTLNGTVATNLATLASGAVLPAAIAVVRGTVYAQPNGTPLPGVTVSILNHPEYTPSVTAADGTFALGVNGGASLTVVYTPPAGATTYLPIQRHTPTQWQQYAVMPDVYLTPLDPNATEIDLDSDNWQSAAGSTITDSADQNGVPGGPPVSPTLPHTARLFFPAATTATFTYGPCGTGNTCSIGTCVTGLCTGDASASLTVRATEFTTGPHGLAAMQAELPLTTGYTYAVALTADEADAAGASDVYFNQAVSFYVDDFIGFGPAQNNTANPFLPVGYYDLATGQWIASPNGNVIEIIAFQGCPGTGCSAVLNEPASGDAGAGEALDLTSDELAFLGQTYSSRELPVYLWRFATTHFSDPDTNSPYGPPPMAMGNNGHPPHLPPPSDPGQCQSTGSSGMGSYIECENQILAEQVSIPGTPYFLRYQSERAPGRTPTINIPLTGSTVVSVTPASAFLRVDAIISVAGRTITMSYPAASLTPNETVTWTWDQKDAFGNTVEGPQLVSVVVSYVYQGIYLGVDEPLAFGQFDPFGSPIATIPIRALTQYAFNTTTTLSIGVPDPAPTGLGGWTLSAQHLYDPASQSLWQGDGKRRDIDRATSIIQTVPGTVLAGELEPAFTPNGSLYMADGGKVVLVSPTGATTLVAGTGTLVGPYANPVLATTASINPTALAAGSDGMLYESNGNVMVNRINPVTGTIQTIAGSATSGCVDSLVATQGELGGATSIAAAPDGSVYLADGVCRSVRRIGTDGTLQTITQVVPNPNLGCRNGTPYASGAPASSICLAGPVAVTVASDGTIYVFDYLLAALLQIDPKTGIITTYAGAPALPKPTPSAYEGVPAAQLYLTSLTDGIAAGDDGTLYISDFGADALYSIDPQKTAHLIAGGGVSTLANEGDMGPAVGSFVFHPGAIAAGHNGSVLVADQGIGSEPTRLRAVQAAFPTYTPGTTAVPSDDGRELFVFSQYGQHLLTVDPITGATIRTFHYDTQNRLTAVVEARGGTTTLSYSGNTVTVTPPFSNGGQVTTLTLDQVGGHAVAIQTPAGEVNQYAYSNGLMTSFLDPKSQLHTFSYDSTGRLLTDTDPTGAVIGLLETVASTPVPTGGGIEPFVSWTTAYTSGAGYTTTHNDFTLSNANRQHVHTAPSGAVTSAIQSPSDLWTFTAKDGTVSTTQLVPDPQFGMVDAYGGTVTRETPSGLSYSAVRTRTSSATGAGPSQILDLTRINGQSTPWSSTYGAAAGATPAHWLYVSPAGRERLEQLDSLGRVTTVSYPGTHSLPTTSFLYDADGRIQTVTLTPNTNGGGAGRVTTNSYDTYLAGYLATVQDAAGDLTIYDQRDLDGRVLDVELPDYVTVPASHVGTTYDSNGNIASVTVPPATTLPSTHTFTSTPVDLLASYTPPQVSASTTGDDPELATLATSYTYNADRQVSTEQEPEGTSYQTVMTDYDAYGRLAATFDPISDVTASYTYVLNASGVSTDQVGSISTSDGVSVTNTFDGFLKRRTQWSSATVAGSVNWTYDDFFRPATLEVDSAPTITFAYDADSLYAGTSTPAFAVTRDVGGSSLDGLPYHAQLGTVSEAWTYDGFGEVASYTVMTSDGTVLYAMSGAGGDGTPIMRDSLGRITSMLETSNGTTHSWAFTYDARSRLESVTEDGGLTTYGYDPNGNLTGLNGDTFGTYDAQDRMVTFAPPGGGISWGLTYTNNGDLLEKGDGTVGYQFGYDLSSNLRYVQLTGGSASGVDYLIDGMNRRIGRAVTSSGATVMDGLLYDEQGRVVAELDGSNNVLSTFVYGLKGNVPDYMVRGGIAYRIISDWRGDVRLVLNTSETGSSAVVEQIDYDEWGNVTNLVDPACTVGGTALCWQPFGFAGGVFDVSTGIVRFGARDYDPQMRRWTQKDSIRFGGGFNVYEYADDDPINGSDPSGLQGGGSWGPTGVVHQQWDPNDDPGGGQCKGGPPPPTPARCDDLCPAGDNKTCLNSCNQNAQSVFQTCLKVVADYKVCKDGLYRMQAECDWCSKNYW